MQDDDMIPLADLAEWIEERRRGGVTAVNGTVLSMAARLLSERAGAEACANGEHDIDFTHSGRKTPMGIVRRCKRCGVGLRATWEVVTPFGEDA